MDFVKSFIHKDNSVKYTVLLFVLLTFWWVLIFLGGTRDAPVNHIFGFIYGGYTIWGGIWALAISYRWGGLKSYIGRALFFISLGLLCQAFGQYSFWFYNFVLRIEVPYPGVPDIGYFGTIPFYFYAAYLLAKSAGVKVTLSTFKSKLQAILIPGGMLVVAYFLFIRNYGFDLSNPLQSFLDYGYPVGQAMYTSVAILTYSLSRKILGGVMRFPILMIVIAFIAQFLADYIFIYFHALYFPASFIDYFYLLAYFLMTLGVLQFGVVLRELD